MKHSNENLQLMKEITSFLKSRNKNYSLWNWAINVPISQRIDELLFFDESLSEAYQNNTKIIKNGSVIDLGCGFCVYWPFLEKLGYTKFLGYDLYAKRGLGDQDYMETARLLVDNFCNDCDFMIVEDDVREILMFEKRKPKYCGDGLIDFVSKKNIDLIITKNTDYQKLGSTGIPEFLFNDICNIFLKPGGIKLYAG